MPKSKEMCSGCHNDFYNGHNEIGVKECWSFKGAKVVQRMRVGTWQRPPYVWSAYKTLSCYLPTRGTSLVCRNDPRVITAKQAEKLARKKSCQS